MGQSAGSGDDEFNRLTELAVTWVMKNPSPITLTKVNYDRSFKNQLKDPLFPGDLFKTALNLN